MRAGRWSFPRWTLSGHQRTVGDQAAAFANRSIENYTAGSLCRAASEARLRREGSARKSLLENYTTVGRTSMMKIKMWQEPSLLQLVLRLD